MFIQLDYYQLYTCRLVSMTFEVLHFLTISLGYSALFICLFFWEFCWLFSPDTWTHLSMYSCICLTNAKISCICISSSDSAQFACKPRQHGGHCVDESPGAPRGPQSVLHSIQIMIPTRMKPERDGASLDQLTCRSCGGMPEANQQPVAGLWSCLCKLS